VKRILTMSSLFFFAVASMSYAANQESGSVSFPSSVRVGTNNLPAGTYKVHWQAGSNDAQVTLSGNGQQITVPATVAPSTRRDEVLEHRDGSAQILDGFTVKDTSFTIKTP
jgi:hypothetical protein